MNGCNTEQLEAWVTGIAIGPRAAEEIAAHVASCAACALEARLLRAEVDALNEAFAPAGPLPDLVVLAGPVGDAVVTSIARAPIAHLPVARVKIDRPDAWTRAGRTAVRWGVTAVAAVSAAAGLVGMLRGASPNDLEFREIRAEPARSPFDEEVRGGRAPSSVSTASRGAEEACGVTRDLVCAAPPTCGADRACVEGDGPSVHAGGTTRSNTCSGVP